MLDPRVFNMNPKDKLTASKSEVRRLDFTGLLRSDFTPLTEPTAPPMRDILTETARGQGRHRGGAMRQSVAEAYADDWDGVGHLRDEEDWRVAPYGANVSDFTRRGARREDTEHGSVLPQTHFDPSLREVFGYSSGDWYPTGGRPVGFYGEKTEMYGEAPQVGETVDSQRLDLEQTNQNILDAQARARGEAGINSAIRSIKSPETGEYDVVSGVSGVSGKGKGKTVRFDLSRNDLPNTLDGFKQLALKMEASGSGKIRINKNSSLKNVRRNFIKRLGL